MANEEPTAVEMSEEEERLRSILIALGADDDGYLHPRAPTQFNELAKRAWAYLQMTTKTPLADLPTYVERVRTSRRMVEAFKADRAIKDPHTSQAELLKAWTEQWKLGEAERTEELRKRLSDLETDNKQKGAALIEVNLLLDKERECIARLSRENDELRAKLKKW
jgi:hypothetical protein